MHTNLHSVLAVVLLFFFGLISPGPNFPGCRRDRAKFRESCWSCNGLGAALGDAVYASVGLFGVTGLITVRPVMVAIEFLGGLYLIWLGVRMLSLRRASAQRHGSPSVEGVSVRAHFWRGLAADLANPKTVVFFAGIFAIAVNPATTGTVRGAMLLGIVLTSVLWRFFVLVVFSTTAIRKVYERTDRTVERLFGAALCFFGLLLVRRTVS
jgi:amino acid exporter